MKILVLWMIIGAVLLAACSPDRPANSGEPVDRVEEPGVTQPSPPEPGTVAGSDARDPERRRPRPISELSHPGEPSEPKPAPEDSEVSAMMNPDGSITEFRVFKAHPDIDKVEANWMMPDEKTIKVFLKGGRVLETKTDKVPYLHNAPSSLLLELVGAKGKKVR